MVLEKVTSGKQHEMSRKSKVGGRGPSFNWALQDRVHKIREPQHAEYLQQTGLADFVVEVCWDTKIYPDSDMIQFIQNYDHEKSKTSVRGHPIDLSMENIWKTFRLEGGGPPLDAKVTNYTPTTFKARRATNGSYKLTDCEHTVVRERLAFQFAAIHIRPAKGEAYSCHIKQVEQSARHDWGETFGGKLRESLGLAHKQFVDGKMSSYTCHFSLHLQIMLSGHTPCIMSSSSPARDASCDDERVQITLNPPIDPVVKELEQDITEEAATVNDAGLDGELGAVQGGDAGERCQSPQYSIGFSVVTPHGIWSQTPPDAGSNGGGVEDDVNNAILPQIATPAVALPGADTCCPCSLLVGALEKQNLLQADENNRMATSFNHKFDLLESQLHQVKLLLEARTPPTTSHNSAGKEDMKPDMRIMSALNLQRKRIFDASAPSSPPPASTQDTQKNKSVRLAEPETATMQPAQFVDPAGKSNCNTTKHERRQNRRWTEEEEQCLRSGVNRFGKGKWNIIRKASLDILKGQREVDLKDKWRNLEKSSHDD